MSQEKKYKIVQGITLVIPEDWEPAIKELMEKEGYVSLPDLIRALITRKMKKIKRERPLPKT